MFSLHFLTHSSVHQSSTDHLPHSNFQNVARKIVVVFFCVCFFSILPFCHAGPCLISWVPLDVTSWAPHWSLEIGVARLYSFFPLACISVFHISAVRVLPVMWRGGCSGCGGCNKHKYRDIWLFGRMMGILLWQHRIRNSMRTPWSKISQSLVFLCILILEDSMKLQFISLIS